MVQPLVKGTPRHVYHESFPEPGAEGRYAEPTAEDQIEYERKYMPDEVTRDLARRMHYAAWRASEARTQRVRANWQASYYRLRDRIVMGNRKLAYRAVRRRMALANRADDSIGDCFLVLIHAVAAYNPWMNVRFSTYAFTCLARALARISRRLIRDRLANALPLDVLIDGEPSSPFAVEPAARLYPVIDEFFRAENPTLTDREKLVLHRRYRLDESDESPTLEAVGRDLGLSKERVRQVQASALGKIRVALSGS